MQSSLSTEHSLVSPVGNAPPFFPELCKPHQAVQYLDPSTVFPGYQGCILGQTGEFGELGESRGRELLAVTNGVELPFSVHDLMLSERSWLLIHTGNACGS